MTAASRQCETPHAQMSREQLFYGGVPVPYSVSWSAEDCFFIGPCKFAGGRTSICQSEARGVGKPRFGSPHAIRQRETIVLGLCDLCGKPLKLSTKVSLSHARPRANANRPGDILQVEPLLHKRCATLSMRHCPSLKRDLASGTAMVRQVSQFDVQLAIMDEIYCEEIAGQAVQAVGHAKVQLLRWIDRDPSWLEAA